ncbi:MAG: sensor histidine kinase, partial [Bacteroidota bacterium]
YIYLYQYDTLNQALFNLEKEKEIQDARGRFEFEKNQRIIAEQQASIARGRSFNLTLGILSILLLSSTMMLFINRARLRAKAQVAQQEIQLVHQRMEDLIRQSELRTINALLEGQEKERVRLSQELHDSVGSVLSAIKLHFTGLTNQWETMQGEFRETFERGTNLLDVAVEEVRRISHNLTTGVLRKFGLIAALEDLKDTLVGTGQIQFQLFAHGMEDRLEGQLEINLYRVVQELVSNTLKHAQAKVITVEVNRRADEINLIISDDGKGFDQESVKSDGIGLQNMQQRIEKLGGNLHIDSVPGRGTTAVIDIPLTADE